MHLSRRAAALAAASFLFVPAARAATPATPEEAKALTEKAAAHIKEVGLDKAMADFNDPAAGYIDRELYVAIYDKDGKLICGYGVPSLVGRVMTAYKDSDGKEFAKDILHIAQQDGTGWAQYRMTNSVTKKVGLKRSYIIRVGDDTVFVGAFID